MPKFIETEVWVIVDGDENVVASDDAEACHERYKEMVGEESTTPRRLIHVTMKVPVPEAVEVAVEIPAESQFRRLAGAKRNEALNAADNQRRGTFRASESAHPTFKASDEIKPGMRVLDRDTGEFGPSGRIESWNYTPGTVTAVKGENVSIRYDDGSSGSHEYWHVAPDKRTGVVRKTTQPEAKPDTVTASVKKDRTAIGDDPDELFNDENVK